MYSEIEESIAAIATPQGRSALGMLRISGNNAFSIVEKTFQPYSGAILSHKPVVGRIHLSSGRTLDEAVVTYFKKPHSYTREDLLEITCHGNPMILDEVLKSLIGAGARMARPGEFTYRAFLNGRLDLVQAEAVDDLINSDSLYQTELALSQLDGRLSRHFQKLKDDLVTLISLMEGNIDFSEEQHYTFITSDESLRRHQELIVSMEQLLGSFHRGRIVKEGFAVAVAGKPNAGKSSVFNYLVGSDRAIVTDVAGTTRDYLHERIRLGNHLIHVFDTAGVRETVEVVEREGVARSHEIIRKADLVLFLLDGRRELGPEDYQLLEVIREIPHLVVVNKVDVPEFRHHRITEEESFPVSATTGIGMDLLLRRLEAIIDEQIRFNQSDTMLSSARHRSLLEAAHESVLHSMESVTAGFSEEAPLVDLHFALTKIGEITGEVTIDDIYGEIFTNFCIGK